MLSTWNAYIPVASGHAGRSPIRARYLAGGPPRMSEYRFSISTMESSGVLLYTFSVLGS